MPSGGTVLPTDSPLFIPSRITCINRNPVFCCCSIIDNLCRMTSNRTKPEKNVIINISKFYSLQHEHKQYVEVRLPEGYKRRPQVLCRHVAPSAASLVHASTVKPVLAGMQELPPPCQYWQGKLVFNIVLANIFTFIEIEIFKIIVVEGTYTVCK